MASSSAAAPHPRAPGGLDRLWRDPYWVAAYVMFATIVFLRWTAHVDTHEMIYLLGSRRLADPSFLANDFTWQHLPPTSALFDHLLAPLWRFCSGFTIVNLGRFATWVLTAWSLAFLGRTMRLPAWSVAFGFVFWLLWRQTLATCGSPLEGFQVKSFSYPLMYFALAFLIRGQPARAGFASGLGTALHIIVGGWGTVALGLAMLFNRRVFTWRQILVFGLAAGLFIAPLLLSVVLFHSSHVTPEEQKRMDWIYSMFAMPHCCDVARFMTPRRWVRAGIIFAFAPLVILPWRERRAGRILGAFVVVLIALFFVGVFARLFDQFGLLKLYPGQLANALPALFLFMFVPGWIGAGISLQRFGRLAWTLSLVATLWLANDREVWSELTGAPEYFHFQVWRHHFPRPEANAKVYEWIRDHTPKNSVFITPMLVGFWMYAERAQVVSMAHPPLDRHLLEWRDRLTALNQDLPFDRQGLDIDEELSVRVSLLPIKDLIRIRDRYGATHYLARGDRHDLDDHRLFSADEFSVYDLRGLTWADTLR